MTCESELGNCEFKLVTWEFGLVTRDFEIMDLNSQLVDLNLYFEAQVDRMPRLSLNDFEEKSLATIIIGKFVNKP